MKLTKKRAIELHRELWDWLYKHPTKSKANWPRWWFNGGDLKSVDASCFLCEYIHGKSGCAGCPLDWSPSVICSAGGYFTGWDEAGTWQTKRKYAKLIRDLPEKR